MSGYTPLFGSLFRGTLCGRWPDIGLWPVLLAMADWRGEIDATQEYISTVTGLAVEEVVACIKRFCAPDPRSRYQVADGARLVLIDPARDWGWRVVNIQKYRDMASGQEQVADGRNAEKVRRYKERHRQTPADTAGHSRTPTHTHTADSDSEKSKNNATYVADVAKSQAERRGTRIPDDPSEVMTADVIAWATRHAPTVKLEEALAEFYDHWHAVPGARGRKLDWPGTFRNRLRELEGRSKQRWGNTAARRPQLLPES